MVRETRHLQIGNLPENITESEILDHFSRYGAVQRVKILGGKCDNISATVSFIDIKAASKAHASENRLENRNLWTKYYEPPFSSSSSSSASSATSSSLTSTATATCPLSSMSSSSLLSSTITANTSNINNIISNLSSISGSQQQQQSSLLTPGSDTSSTFKDDRPTAICVRNLPIRSTDSSLKDGLFHEYKKHGKVTMVKVTGQGTDRVAVVCFKKAEDAEKALEVSKNKLFFGCKIEVTPHEGIDAEDNDFRPLETELDEYHPKATRTLFVGNLEKDITTQELRSHFEIFGEIIEIDIKKQGTSTYAFIQYSDISSVVKGMRKLDGENLGANRIKLGFGKSMPTNCVWLHGISESTSDKCLFRQCARFGTVVQLTVDRERGKCLVCYDSVDSAQIAVTDLKGRLFNGRRLQVDFASRECQNAFFEKLENVIKINKKSLSSSSSSSTTTTTTSTSGSVKSKTGIGVHGAKETSAIPLKTVDATSSVINRSLSDPRRQSTSTVHHHLNSFSSSSEFPSSSTPTTTGNLVNSNSGLLGVTGNLSSSVTNPSFSNTSSSGPSSLDSIRSLDDYTSSISTATTTTSTLKATTPTAPGNPVSISHHHTNNNRKRLSDSCDLTTPLDTNTLLSSLATRVSSSDTLGSSSVNSQQDVHSTTTRSDEHNSNEVSSSSDKVGCTIGSSRRSSLNNTNITNNNSNGNNTNSSINNNNSSRSFESSGLNLPDNGTVINISSNFPLSLPLPEFAASLRSSSSSSSSNKSAHHHSNSSSSHRNLSTSGSSLAHQQQSSSSSTQPPLSSLSSSFSIQSKDSSSLPQVPHSSPKGNSIMSPLSNLSPSSIQVPKRLRTRSTESKTDCIVSTPTTSSSSFTTTTTTTSPSTLLSSLSSSTSSLLSSSSNLTPSGSGDTTFNNHNDKLYYNVNTSASTKSNLNNNIKDYVKEKDIILLTGSGSIDTTDSLILTSTGNSNSKLTSSSPSLISPTKMSIEDRIKALDEKYIPWRGGAGIGSGSASSVNVKGSGIDGSSSVFSSTITLDYSKYNIKKKSHVNLSSSLNSQRTEPSDIVRSLLSKSSIFDQDSKRLEHINEKYEPKEKITASLAGVGDIGSSLKPVFRTKAAAKEFSTPLIDDKLSSLSSSSVDSKSHHYPQPSYLNADAKAHHHHPPLFTRKLSEPWKLSTVDGKKSGNNTPNTPNTPQSAPARCGSFSPFLSSISSSSLTSSTITTATTATTITTITTTTTTPSSSATTTTSTTGASTASSLTCSNLPPTSSRLASISSSTTGTSLSGSFLTASAVSSLSSSGSSSSSVAPNLLNRASSCSTSNLSGSSTVSSSTVKKDNIGLNNVSSSSKNDSRRLSATSDPRQSNSSTNNSAKRDNTTTIPTTSNQRKDLLSGNSSTSNSVSYTSAYVNNLSHHLETSSAGSVNKRSNQHHHSSSTSQSSFGQNVKPLSSSRSDLKKTETLSNATYNRHSSSDDVDQDSDNHSCFIGESNTNRHDPSGNNSSRKGDKTKSNQKEEKNESGKESGNNIGSSSLSSSFLTSSSSSSIAANSNNNSSILHSPTKKHEKERKNSYNSGTDGGNNISSSKLNGKSRSIGDILGGNGNSKSSKEERKMFKKEKQLHKGSSESSSINKERVKLKSQSSSLSSSSGTQQHQEKRNVEGKEKSKEKSGKKEKDKDKNREKSGKMGEKEGKGSKEKERKTQEEKDREMAEREEKKQLARYRSEMKKLGITDDEPIYFSMYDKVKARSSHNQSLKEANKDMDAMRQKFNVLKQSRSKKEGRGSHNTDSESDDSDSDSGGGAGSGAGSGADRPGMDIIGQRTSSSSSSMTASSLNPAGSTSLSSMSTTSATTTITATTTTSTTSSLITTATATAAATSSTSSSLSSASASATAASSCTSSSLNRSSSKSKSNNGAKKRKLIIASSPSSSDNDGDMEDEIPSSITGISTFGGNSSKVNSMSKKVKKSAPPKPLDSDSDSEFSFEALLASTMANSAPSSSSTHKKAKDPIYSSDSDEEISMASPRYNKTKPFHKLTEDSSDEEIIAKPKIPKKAKKEVSTSSNHSISNKQKKSSKEGSFDVRVKEEKMDDRSERHHHHHHRDNDKEDKDNEPHPRGLSSSTKEDKKEGSMVTITSSSSNHPLLASSSSTSSSTASSKWSSSFSSIHHHKGDTISSSKDKSEEKIFKKKIKSSLKEKDKDRNGGDHREGDKSHSTPTTTTSSHKLRVEDREDDGPTIAKRSKEDKLVLKEKSKENKDGHLEKVKDKCHVKHDKIHDTVLSKLDKGIDGNNKLLTTTTTTTTSSTHYDKSVSDKIEKKQHQQQRLQSSMSSGLCGGDDDFTESEKSKLSMKKKKKKLKSLKSKDKDKKFKERSCSESSSREKSTSKFESDYKMESDGDLRSDASDFEQSLQRIEKIVSQADCEPELLPVRVTVLKCGPENSDKTSSPSTTTVSSSSIWDKNHPIGGSIKSSGLSKHDVPTKSVSYNLDRLSDHSASTFGSSVLSEKSNNKANKKWLKEVHANNNSGNILLSTSTTSTSSSSSVDTSATLHGKESKEASETNSHHSHLYRDGKDGLTGNIVEASGGKKKEKEFKVKSSSNSEVKKKSKKVKDRDRLTSCSTLKDNSASISTTTSTTVGGTTSVIKDKEREISGHRKSSSFVAVDEKKVDKEKSLEKETMKDKMVYETKVKLELASSVTGVFDDKINIEKPVIKEEKKDDESHHHKVGSVKRVKSPSPLKKLSNVSSISDVLVEKKIASSGLGETGESTNKDKYHSHHHHHHQRLSSSSGSIPKDEDDLETREQALLLEKAIFNSHSSEENSVDGFSSLHSTHNSSSAGLKVASGSSALSKEEKIIRERRFEEEAAIETQRLVEELKSDESWNHFKEPKGLFDELIVSCSEKDDELTKPVMEDKRRILESNIFGAIPSGPESKVSFPHHLHHPSILNVDPFKVDDVKECEIDDQRKIEDDLAVSALLQEMNVETIPELGSKEPEQYIDRIVSPAGPEIDMGYMVTDEEAPLQIAEEVEDSPAGKCDDSTEDVAAVNSVVSTMNSKSVNSVNSIRTKSGIGKNSTSFTPSLSLSSSTSSSGTTNITNMVNNANKSGGTSSSTVNSSSPIISSTTTICQSSKEEKESIKNVDSTGKFLSPTLSAFSSSSSSSSSFSSSSSASSPSEMEVSETATNNNQQRKMVDDINNSVNSVDTTSSSVVVTTPVTSTINSTIPSRRISLLQESKTIDDKKEYSEDVLTTSKPSSSLSSSLSSTSPSIVKTTAAQSILTTIPSSTTISPSSPLKTTLTAPSTTTTVTVVTSSTISLATSSPSSSITSTCSPVTSSSILSRRRSSAKSDDKNIESTPCSEKKRENQVSGIMGEESSIIKEHSIGLGIGTTLAIQEERRPNEAQSSSLSSDLYLDSNHIDASENDGCFDDGEEGNEKLIIDETPLTDKIPSTSDSPFHQSETGESLLGKSEIDSHHQQKTEPRQRLSHREDDFSLGGDNDDDDDNCSRPVFDEPDSDGSMTTNEASKTSKFINESIIDSLLSDSSNNNVKKQQPDTSSDSSEKTELFDDDLPQVNEIDNKRESLEEDDGDVNTSSSLSDKHQSLEKVKRSTEYSDLVKLDSKINVALSDCKSSQNEGESENEVDSENESKPLIFSLSKGQFRSISESSSHFPNIKIDFAKEALSRSTEDEGKDELSRDDNSRQDDEGDERSKGSLERPRRGRRAKTRKYSESSLQLPRYESGCSDSHAGDSQKKGKSPVSERPKRHLRGSNFAGEFNSDDQHANDNESNYLSDDEPSIYFFKHSVNDSHLHHDTSSQDKSDTRKKRGRRKKVSGNESSSCKPHEIDIPSKQKERIFLSVSTVSSSEKQSTLSNETRKSLSPYDVFEFRDSDEEGPPSLPLESMHSCSQAKIIDHKAQHQHAHVPQSTASSSQHHYSAHHHSQVQLPNSSVSVISSSIQSSTLQSSSHQHVHHHSTHPSSSLSSNSSHHHNESIEKKSEEIVSPTLTSSSSTPTATTTITTTTTTTTTPSITSSSVKTEHINETTSSKEYVTELSQHGKLSITIRLHPKEGQDGKDGSTAEVVKTSKALLPDDDKWEGDKGDINVSGTIGESISSTVTNQQSSVPSLSTALTSSASLNASGSTNVITSGSNVPATSATSSSSTVKPTRKSARLMSQANKTTVDEVIEDVVKGVGSYKLELNKSSKRSTRMSKKTDEIHEEEEEEELFPDSKNDSVDSEGKADSKGAVCTLRITRSVAKGGCNTSTTTTTTSEFETTGSTSSGKDLIIESNQKRPTLPVLKVELPKMPSLGRIIERKTESNATTTTTTTTSTISTTTVSSVTMSITTTTTPSTTSTITPIITTPNLNDQKLKQSESQSQIQQQSDISAPTSLPTTIQSQSQPNQKQQKQPAPIPVLVPAKPQNSITETTPSSVSSADDNEIPKLHPFAKIIDRKHDSSIVTTSHVDEKPKIQEQPISLQTHPQQPQSNSASVLVPSANPPIVDKVETTRLPFSKIFDRKSDTLKAAAVAAAAAADLSQSNEQLQQHAQVKVPQPLQHQQPLPHHFQQQKSISSTSPLSINIKHEDNVELPKVPPLGKIIDRKPELMSSMSPFHPDQQHFQQKQHFHQTSSSRPPSNSSVLSNPSVSLGSGVDISKVPFGKIFDRKPESAAYLNEQQHHQQILLHQHHHQQQQQLIQQQQHSRSGTPTSMLQANVAIQQQQQKKHPHHQSQSSTPVPQSPMLSPNVSLVPNVELSKLPFGKIIERSTESSPAPAPSPYLNEQHQQQLLLMQHHQQQQKQHQLQQHQQQLHHHQQQQQQQQHHHQLQQQQLHQQLQQQRQSATPTTPILPPNIAIQHHQQQTKQQPSPTSASSALSPNIPVSDNVDIMYIPSMPSAMRNLAAAASPGPYLRPSSQPSPSMIVPSHLALHSNAYLQHQQMMYATHPHYSQMHPQMRAQLEDQARAVAAMRLPPRFPYPPGFPLPLISDDKPPLPPPLPYGPPPAHAMSQPSPLHPQPHPQTPPHASQVPPQGYSSLLERFPVLWQGLLALKNDQAAVQMHFVSGSHRVAEASLPAITEGGTPPVRIAQRMRLEPSQLEVVARKMQMQDEHATLLALPTGRDQMDVLFQSNNLRNGFINYLQSKQAAGIVNSNAPGSQQPAYVIHIFPSCDFSNENLARIAPDLFHSISEIAHLLIIIATV